MRLVGAVSWVFPAILLAGRLGCCQVRSSGLLGSVVSSSGQPISGVRLQLVRSGCKTPLAATTSDSHGNFEFIGLPNSSYALTSLYRSWHARVGHLFLPPDGTISLRLLLLPPRAGTKPELLLISSHRIEPWWGKDVNSTGLQELPNSRNVWSLLESQVPSTVTTHLDVSELETANPALFGALGASWTENRYSLNGFDETDPYTTGKALVNPGIDALREVNVTTASKPTSLAGSGSDVAVEVPPPSKTLHGATQFFYSARALQSDNMNNRLRRLHFPGPERMNNLEDFSGQLGGKLRLGGATMPFFVSGSTQRLDKSLGGFSAPIRAHVSRALLRLTPWQNTTQQWNLLYAAEHIFDSRQGASLLISPTSTTIGDRSFNQFQATWNKSLSPSKVLSAGFGVTNAVISSGLQNSPPLLSTLDLPSMQRSGVAPFSLSGWRGIYEGYLSFQGGLKNTLGFHSLRADVDWERSDFANRWNAFGNEEQILVSGSPSELVRWNTPTKARAHVQNLALFLQDAWQPFRCLSLSPGLRTDFASGRATGGNNGINWTTVEPRIGLTVPLTRHGPVLRASWSRYAHLLQGKYLDFGDPAALGGETINRASGEILRLFGGPHSVLDPDLAYPFTDEITAGLEQDFGPHLQASLRLLRRDDYRLVGIRNAGVPFADYSPVPVLDPGNDGIYGTSDDQLLTLYNENLAALGHDLLVLTNPSLEAHSEAFEIRLQGSVERRVQFSASFLGLRTLATTSPGDSVFENDTGAIGTLGIDPNTFVMATGRTYFDRAFVGKLAAIYHFHHGFYVAAVGKYYDGLPFGRLLFVNGFNQGPFFVMATPRGHPGGFQTEYNSTLDLRLARDFNLLRGQLSTFLDAFNALNTSNNTLENPLTGPTFQDRVPLAIEPPRTFRLGLRWTF